MQNTFYADIFISSNVMSSWNGNVKKGFFSLNQTSSKPICSSKTMAVSIFCYYYGNIQIKSAKFSLN